MAVKQITRDYAHVFGSEAGRRVLADIMAACHVLEGVTSTDPTALAIMAGRRDIAVGILRRMELQAADYPAIVASTLAREDHEKT